jgi:hypothetical protein
MSAYETETIKRRLDAERVTLLAEGFLNRMGYKRAMIHPKKATLEGEKFLVEVEVNKKTATVQIDLATGEIKGYQIEESGESNFPLSRGTLLLLAGSIGIVAVALVAVKLLGII